MHFLEKLGTGLAIILMPEQKAPGAGSGWKNKPIFKEIDYESCNPVSPYDEPKGY
ncbi:hypothetical protein AGMMS49942_25570 [Spirochaetia bacterium]|nr:hypothetical protein AGMMS49942_25570 [Spirochaetia bacterium]